MLILSCVSFNTFYPLLTRANIEIKTNELFYTLWSPEVEKQQSVTVRGQGIIIEMWSGHSIKEKGNLQHSLGSDVICVRSSSSTYRQ